MLKSLSVKAGRTSANCGFHHRTHFINYLYILVNKNVKNTVRCFSLQALEFLSYTSPCLLHMSTRFGLLGYKNTFYFMIKYTVTHPKKQAFGRKSYQENSGIRKKHGGTPPKQCTAVFYFPYFPSASLIRAIRLSITSFVSSGFMLMYTARESLSRVPGHMSFR